MFPVSVTHHHALLHSARDIKVGKCCYFIPPCGSEVICWSGHVTWKKPADPDTWGLVTWSISAAAYPPAVIREGLTHIVPAAPGVGEEEMGY